MKYAATVGTALLLASLSTAQVCPVYSSPGIAGSGAATGGSSTAGSGLPSGSATTAGTPAGSPGGPGSSTTASQGGQGIGRGGSRATTGGSVRNPGRGGRTGICAVGRGRAGTAEASFVESLDRWDVWWETNKFDFIDLPRQGSPERRGAPGTTTSRYSEDESRTNARPAVLAAMRDLAASSDAAVRSSAIVALGKLHDHDSIDMIQEALGDGSFQVRRAAMLSLGVMESGRGAYALMSIAQETPMACDLLGTTSIPVDDRGSALLSAALRGDSASTLLVERLLAAHGKVDDELLSLACDAAGLMATDDHLDTLMTIADDDDLPEFVRSSAVTAIGRIAEPFAIPKLVELLDDDIEPRRAAAIALGYAAHGGQSHVVERLGEALDDRDAPTRHFAAISLGRLGGSGARAELEVAFRDPDSDMRPWLAIGLALCERDHDHADPANSNLSANLAKRYAGEANRDSRGAYLIALGLCGDDTALETLAEATRSSNVAIAGYAAVSLGLTGRPEAGPFLRDVLAQATAPTVLRQAAFGLGILGDRSSVPHLVELIRTTNNSLVAGYAALGVAFIGDADASGALLHLIEQQGPQGVTTTFAAAAVGQLFDQDPRPALSRLAAGDNYLSRGTALSDLLQLGF